MNNYSQDASRENFVCWSKKGKNLIAVICLILFSDSFLRGRGESVTSLIFLKCLFSSLLLAVVVLLGVRDGSASERGSFFKTSWALIILVGYCLVTSLWASPLTSYQYTAAPLLLLETLIGLTLSLSFSSQERGQIYYSMFAFVLVASLITAIFLPQYGVTLGFSTSQQQAHHGDWRGLFIHKQFLGIFSGLAALFFWTNMKGLSKTSIYTYFLFLLSVALVLLSNSATALSCLALAFVGGRLVSLAANRPLFFVVQALALVAVGVVVYQNFSEVTRILGKDATLSGRLPLWALCIKFAETHLLWGWGMGGFWVSTADHSFITSPHLEKIKQLLTFDPQHSHSGYLDTVLESGLFGLVVLFVFLVLFVKACVRSAKEKMSPSSWDENAFGCYFLVFYLLVNITEGFFPIKRGSLYWVLCVALFSTFRSAYCRKVKRLVVN